MSLIFACLLIHIIACHAKLKIECLVDYLKFRNVRDDAYESVDAYTGDPGTCADEVKTKISDIYGAARSKMETHIKQRPYADCAMKDVENEAYENLLLKAEAIEMKGVGLKFWKLSSKKSKVEELQRQAQDIVDTAIIKCKGQTDYGLFFTQFYEQKQSELSNDELDYCMRKHLIDRSVINPGLYNFKLNPKNLRTDSINCADMMQANLEQMKASISNSGSQCVTDAFINNGYLELIMKIQLLSKLNLTSAEKLLEKRNFIDAMINMTHQIKSCPM